MPREYVTGSCGHQVRFGWGRAEALTAKQIGERRAAARQRTCWECYKAHQAAQALDIAVHYGFPPLVGTPKQVAWAESIRAQAAMRMLADGGTEADLSGIAHQTRAKWWIEHRDDLHCARRERHKPDGSVEIRGGPGALELAARLAAWSAAQTDSDGDDSPDADTLNAVFAGASA